MRALVILNPCADRGRAIQHKSLIESFNKQFTELRVMLTQQPGHGTEIARQAAHEYDVVVAAGGDGTVHEVVNGLVQSGQSQTQLGVIPIGSGNDFAYAFGIPASDPQAALMRLSAGIPKSIDLARIEDNRGRTLIIDNNVGIGFDALVSIESRNIKRIHGFAAYFLATIRTLANDYHPFHFEISFDDQSVSQEAIMFTIGVGPRSGGGFLITPDARHNDNWLDSCLVKPIGRLTILGLMPKVMQGTHTSSPHASFRRSRRVELHASQPLPIHIDGEIFARPEDNVRHLIITSLPDALRILA